MVFVRRSSLVRLGVVSCLYIFFFFGVYHILFSILNFFSIPVGVGWFVRLASFLSYLASLISLFFFSFLLCFGYIS